MLITTGIAVLYVVTATKTYEAEAEMLVTPVTSADPMLASLGLIARLQRPDPRRRDGLELVTNTDVAEAAEKDGTPLDARPCSTRSAPSRSPRATSSPSPPPRPRRRLAKELANAFAEQAVRNAPKRLHEQIEAACRA